MKKAPETQLRPCIARESLRGGSANSAAGTPAELELAGGGGGGGESTKDKLGAWDLWVLGIPVRCCQQTGFSVSTHPIIHSHLLGGCSKGEREPVEMQKKHAFACFLLNLAPLFSREASVTKKKLLI